MSVFTTMVVAVWTLLSQTKKHVDRVAQSFEVECHVLCISAVTITAVCTRGHILINL